jgi:transcriptional regulator with XRE-family HTH domain
VNNWRERLRLAVDRVNRKHSWVADCAGIAPATLSRILTGRAQPSFEIVVRVARACNVRVGWLLDEPVRGVEFTDAEVRTLTEAGVILLDALRRRDRRRE